MGAYAGKWDHSKTTEDDPGSRRERARLERSYCFPLDNPRGLWRRDAKVA